MRYSLRTNRIFHLLFILIVSLTPLLWFKPNTYISGVDVNFSLFPKQRLIDRSYVWHSDVAGGSDRSNDVASLPYILPQAILSSMGFNTINVEKITYVMWFFFAGLSMYFLASVVIDEDDPNREKIKTASATIYLFNFYQPFLWARLQLAITTLVLIPLFLGMLIGILHKKISKKKAFFIVSLAAFIGGPIGIQPPLIMIMLFLLISYLIYYICVELNKKSIHEIFFAIKDFCSLSLIFLLSSLFWFLPLVNFIRQAGYMNKSIGIETYAVHNLLHWVSSYTSLTNVFRLFGDVSYFDSWGGQRYLQQFSPYQNSPILIALSFVLPTIAFSALFIKGTKQKKIAFFSFIALIGIFLGKGTHMPFGRIYSWLIDNVPMFWIQRAPWQKFTILTIISYSVLGGITLGKLYEIFSKNIKTKIFSQAAWFGFLVIFIIGYNYFFWKGMMFPSNEGNTGYNNKFNLTFHLKPPPYILEAREWINNQKDYYKMVLFPDDKVNVYDWGYGGTADITGDLFNKGLLQRLYGEGYAPGQSIDKIYDLFVNLTYNQSSVNALELMRLAGVKYILQRNDFRYDFYGDIDSPTFIKSILKQQKAILEKRIGKWDFYTVPNSYPSIYIPNYVVNIKGDIIGVTSFLSTNYFNSKQNYLFNFGKKLSFPNISSTQVLQNSLSTKTISKDGFKIPFSWNKIQNNNEIAFDARYYIGSKGVISSNGVGKQDMLIFSSKNQIPYKFYEGKTAWSSFNSTHLYIITSTNPLTITGIYEQNKPVTDIIGIWWETGFKGAGVTTAGLSVVVPPHQKIIIQLGHLVEDKTITITSLSNQLKVGTTKTTKNTVKSHVEFKRINPTEYIVKIHRVKTSFPLVLFEQFHLGWVAIPIKIKNNYIKPAQIMVNKYKVFKGNEKTQANKTEVLQFVKEGLVTNIGNGKQKNIDHTVFSEWKEKTIYSEKYTVDYISKKNRNSIQNNNLVQPNFLEVLFTKPIPSKHHFVANGFSNGWIIKPEEVCKVSKNCLVNRDGSYDMEIVIEYRPQRLFYIGLILSIITLFATAIVLLKRK